MSRQILFSVFLFALIPSAAAAQEGPTPPPKASPAAAGNPPTNAAKPKTITPFVERKASPSVKKNKGHKPGSEADRRRQVHARRWRAHHRHLVDGEPANGGRHRVSSTVVPAAARPRFFLELGMGYGICRGKGDICEPIDGDLAIRVSAFRWLGEYLAVGVAWNYQRLEAGATDEWGYKWSNINTNRSLGLAARLFALPRASGINFFVGFGFGFGEGTFSYSENGAYVSDSTTYEYDYDFISISAGTSFQLSSSTALTAALRYQRNDWKIDSNVAARQAGIDFISFLVGASYEF